MRASWSLGMLNRYIKQHGYIGPLVKKKQNIIKGLKLIRERGGTTGIYTTKKATLPDP